MMEELDRKTRQSRESEDRYRKFIEMAKSAVVTFMEDGKIIISNQKAEELIGLSRQAILGENIFSFLVNGENFRNEIAIYVQEGKGKCVGETTIQRIKDFRGGIKEIEMALTASMTDKKPLFTAILRELSK
jgi:PAS domain S-box-containing protein